MATKKPARRTNAQNARIWALSSNLQRNGLSKDDAETVVRDACEVISGHRHTSRLTLYQAAKLIHQLEEAVERSQPAPTQHNDTADQVPPRTPWGPRGPGERSDRTITPKLQATLQALYVQAGMETGEQQRAFCMRQTKRPWPQTMRDFDAVMEALKAMILRPETVQKTRDRFFALRGHPALDAWKTGFIDDVCERYEKARDPSKVLTTHRLKKLVECEAAVAKAAQ